MPAQPQPSQPDRPQSSGYSNLQLYPDAPISAALSSAPASLQGYPDLNLYPQSAPSDRIQREPQDSAPAADPAQPLDHSPAGQPSSQQAAPQATPEQLERLAQEIYRLVRQRLALERERNGHFYRGRF